MNYMHLNIRMKRWIAGWIFVVYTMLWRSVEMKLQGFILHVGAAYKLLIIYSNLRWIALRFIKFIQRVLLKLQL